MSNETLMVTGASGNLGGRVLQLLQLAGANVTAGTRTPEKLTGARKVDFDDEAGLVASFEGVDRLLIVSTDAVGVSGKRHAQQSRAIRAAKAAGVKHVLYTSFTNPAPDSAVAIAADHRNTEADLVASGLGYTVLRNNLYADLLLQSLPQAIATGLLYTAREDGAISYVTREDCAQAAAAAMLDGFEGQRVLEVTGPEAVTGQELAQLVSELTDRPVQHVSIPPEALKQAMVNGGLPPVLADMLVSFEVAAARGELASVGLGASQIGAPAPQSIRAFLTQNGAALA